MTEYGTIRIPRETYEKHNQRRKDLGVTWAEYIDGEAPDGRDEVDFAELVDEMARKTADELEGRMR